MIRSKHRRQELADSIASSLDGHTDGSPKSERTPRIDDRDRAGIRSRPQTLVAVAMTAGVLVLPAMILLYLLSR